MASHLRRLTYAKHRYFRLLNRERSISFPHQFKRQYQDTNKQDIEDDPDDFHHEDVKNEQYPGHIPTSFFQKALLTVGSASMCLYDPYRDDMVATLGEVSGAMAIKRLKEKMEEDPVGRLILEEQPVINTDTVSIEYLGSLPKGTLGKEYWKFLSKNGFSPDSRMPVQFIDDPTLKYVMLRYRQTHDLYHSVLGMKPTILGEVVVKWVETFQTGLPMCALAAVFGPLRLSQEHQKLYLETYLSWAIRTGRNAKFLMAVYWEKEWEKDLDQLRTELNIEPPPVLK
ncbi:ubiquinone biosynthesis protein COQ4 homolog, mitochondrial-like [Ylistrum balloti]|uniref:ubiquinone biosynthesis protein COQ4 homolog, mitochondrial-like n=1 Tax=Ylistrum balloti TaxID=509963 RepID=UPI002905CEC1|nr:ubiquinone biosynthesis protein COQ4 homolog, mitochondrial-like [Ylistrum balloti]